MRTSPIVAPPCELTLSGMTLVSEGGLSVSDSITLAEDEDPAYSPFERYADELQLYVAQYLKQPDGTNPTLHWDLVIRTCGSRTTSGTLEPMGNVYHFAGCEDVEAVGYAEAPEYTEACEYERSSYWRGSALVGTILSGDLHAVEGVIRRVLIMPGDPDSGCRRWTFDAIQALHAEGFEMEEFCDMKGLEQRMRDALEDWENDSTSRTH